MIKVPNERLSDALIVLSGLGAGGLMAYMRGALLTITAFGILTGLVWMLNSRWAAWMLFTRMAIPASFAAVILGAATGRWL